MPRWAWHPRIAFYFVLVAGEREPISCVQYPPAVPSPQTLTLAAGDTVTFIGNYLCGPTGFVFVPGGTFAMGSPVDEPGRVADETQHQVTLTHGFYIETT